MTGRGHSSAVCRFRCAALLGLCFAAALGGSARAGDILRGGAARADSSARLRASESQVDAVASQLSGNAADALARTTQAVQSVRAMQDAARQISAVRASAGLDFKGQALPAVPNGLRPGGLEVAPEVLAGNKDLWKGAKLPVQSNNSAGTNVVIQQLQPTAILNWKTFNVGKGTNVIFNQSIGGERKAEWIAFNKINDPSGKPSQILGSIKADGQVYLINRNGIIFGGTSVIEVHTLTASTLPINDNLIKQGLLNNRDAQFLFSALPVPGGSDGTAAFNPTINDRPFVVAAAGDTYTLNEKLAVDNAGAAVRPVEFTIPAAGGTSTKLIAGTDYTLAIDSATKQATATFTAAGVAKIGSATVKATYTPAVVKSGDIRIDAGAQISSPVSADGNGGRLMFVAPNVTNSGTLSTPAGQTILAAGQQVGIVEHASGDPSLRGLDVYVGAVADGTGTATNSGLIEAFRGSVSMSGKTVNQSGVIDSSTSVDLNGRIDLRASYGAVGNPQFDNTGAGSGGPPFLFQKTGTVTLGEGSVTRILPDYLSERTVPGTSLPERSQIHIEGRAVHFRTTAEILAPNAEVSVRAGVWPYQDTDGNRTTLDAAGQPEASLGSRIVSGEQRFLFEGGQIYLDQGVSINVAGSTDVFVPLAQSILDVEFRGAEFADSPLQRDGLLRGVALTVDLRRTGAYDGRYWMGTPLGDVTGLAGLIQRNVAQLTTAGGSVTLQAGNSIVLQKGATIDVSGGFVRHEAGMVKTTRLWQNGNLVDIADAVPDQTYDGIFTGTFTVSHPKYGISETFATPFMSAEHFEPSYVEGAAGGQVTLTAPSMAIEATLLGTTLQGSRQRSLPPDHSSLSIKFAAETAVSISPTEVRYFPTSPTPPRVTFSPVADATPIAPFQLVGDDAAPLTGSHLTSVQLSTALVGPNGFGNVSVENTDGEVVVPAGVSLEAQPLGSVSLTGANVSIAGDVTAPGGKLSFLAYNISPAVAAQLSLTQQLQAPAPNVDRGIFSLSAGATLSTAGLVVDDRLSQRDPLAPLVTAGGDVTITAYTANLDAGTTIDVSGGAAVSSRGAVSYGKAGSITIRAGKDPALGAVLGGKLKLGSTLEGYSGGTGGSLTLQATAIQIGGAAAFPNTLLLQPDFFRQGGFTSYALEGIGAPSDATAGPGEPDPYTPGIVIAPGTLIEPVAEKLLATNLFGDGEIGFTKMLLPAGQRAAASLSLTALGADDALTLEKLEVRGDLIMGAGSRITVDPGAKVSLKGDTVSVGGSIYAPGGTITIAGASRFRLVGQAAVNEEFGRSTVYISPQTTLSTAGTAIYVPDAFGRRLGTLFPGGTITISGNIVAESGAVFDVSGASAIFDVHPATLGLASTPIVPVTSGLNSPLWRLLGVPTRMDSSGGLLELNGSEMLYSDATLIGRAGGPTAEAGTLSIFSGRYYSAVEARTSADINLIVTQSGNVIPPSFKNRGVGLRVGTEKGIGHFTADRFAAGGFASLDLGAKYLESASPLPYGGNVKFVGPVTINAPGYLRVAGGGIIEADSTVSLTGSYVAIGQPFNEPLEPSLIVRYLPFQQTNSPTLEYNPVPTSGPGSLIIQGEFIDAGYLSLQGISKASLLADGGDVRGNGTLNLAGDLYIRAAQVYPTTVGDFTIVAYDHNVVVASATSGSATVTLASATLPPGFRVGSSLLGSTVAKIEGATITLAAGANASISAPTPISFAGSTVRIAASGTAQAPLSAGGSLSIFAANIIQDGVLRAPFGRITLGWDGTDFDPSDAAFDTPFDAITNGRLTVPTANLVRLSADSLTSVAGIDYGSNTEMLIPYGLSQDGLTWFDPRGVNITVTGAPQKQVAIAGNNVVTETGSQIDIRGGGDLFAYRWVSGPGGSVDIFATATATWAAAAEYQPGDLVTYGGKTWSARVRHSGETPSISLYWSEVPESYAVIPGFSSPLAPFAKYSASINFTGDPGYVSNTLHVGDRVYLDKTPGLDAGYYTLLPRRYALLPGAFVITPTSSEPRGTFTLTDGSTLTAGYRFNTFTSPLEVSPVRAQFEVAPYDTFSQRAAYSLYYGTEFFQAAAQRFDIDQPQELPIDSGYLSFQGNVGLRPEGNVLTSHAPNGRGASIDLSSFGDILIIGGNAAAPAGAKIVLRTSVLESWGADSLLIGGLRRSGTGGTTVEVRAGSVTLNNPGDAFGAPEIVLAANNGVTIAPGSVIGQSGKLTSPAATLLPTGRTQLAASGDSLTFTGGGVPISFPNGTPGNNLITATVAGTITLANGTTQTLAANTPTALPAGSTVTLGTAGAISFASGTGGPIPIALGDGVLVRVSSDPAAQIVRSGVAGSTAPTLTVGANARIGGANVTLDSTYGTSIDPTVALNARTLALGAGQISILLQPTATLTGQVVNPQLVLSGELLESVQKVQALTLRSSQSIDLYGTGEFGAGLGSLSLLTSTLRGYDQGAGTATIRAGKVLFDNPSNFAALAAPAVTSGALEVAAGQVRFGSNAFTVSGYADVALTATGGMLGQGTGSFSTAGNLTLTAPVITGTRGATQSINAGGDLVLASAPGAAAVAGGLGASFSFTGRSITANTDIRLPSGQITLKATGTGADDDVTVGGRLDVSGTQQAFYDLIRFSSAGNITLISKSGDVTLENGSTVSVAAAPAGGDAGTVTISAANGAFTNSGATLLGSAALGRASGRFIADVGSLPSFTDLSAALNDGGFYEERNLRVRTGDVTIANVAGQANVARDFTVSTDTGSIIVEGTIDASWKRGLSDDEAARIPIEDRTGGTITLIAGNSLTLTSTAVLDARAQIFSNAGKGGSIRLESGALVTGGVANEAGVLDLQAGSRIELGVSEYVAGDYTTPGSSAFEGQFQGTLHLRAPRTGGGTGIAISTIAATINDASSILAEGYKVYTVTGADGTITTALQTQIRTEGEAYLGAAGTTTANYTNLFNTLVGGQTSDVQSAFVLAPGAEIRNTNGNITLGTSSSTSTSDWNLSTFRFGPNRAAGVLTLRASQDLVFNNTLSDGFTPVASNAASGNSTMWLAPLMDLNPLLPVNTQSWSFRFAAGSDLAAADFTRVLALDELTAGKGSVLVGKVFTIPTVTLGQAATVTTASVISNRFQVIRTGTGDIDIAAGRDVQLRNQFSTIYTAGVRIPTSTATTMSIFSPNDFVIPNVTPDSHPSQTGTGLGAIQQNYAPQWSMAGGNVTITAQGDINHGFITTGGRTIADSTAQLPMNWLYRRGLVDPATGLFYGGLVSFSGNVTNVTDPATSTTWWVDFSNFFEGIGALGGGDVTLIAGNDVVNVDAVAPTNARMAGRVKNADGTFTNLAPDSANLLELGGGDIVIRAGRNIDGGVYYVERGTGTLFAGGEIKTNESRAPIAGNNSLTWLPTTLFLGKGSYDVAARGNVLLGPVVNPFILPQGVNNKFWYKTYFDTYSADSSVDVSSFGGSITHRLAASINNVDNVERILTLWLRNKNVFQQQSITIASSQPWLRLAEVPSALSVFETATTTMPPTLRSTAFAGDVKIVGKLNLFPSPTGTLELAASGSVIGLNPSGVNGTLTNWTAASINVSDADPLSFNSVLTPLGYQNLVGNVPLSLIGTNGLVANPLASFTAAFAETGSFAGASAGFSVQQALHDSGLLHTGDSEPVRIYALGGDITGFTLFTPKVTQVVAANDITDVSLYLQNVDDGDVSIVSAGRDIIPFNESGALRALASDNVRNQVIDVARATVSGTATRALAGDLQMNGPGVLEVLAGRNLDLGTGANFPDGTGTGLTSVGTSRNPFLAFTGADLIALAGVSGPGGIGAALGLSQSSLDFTALDLDTLSAADVADSAYLTRLGSEISFDSLTEEQKAIVGLERFFALLRNSGRDGAGTGDYSEGYAAVDALFGSNTTPGEIFTRARDIRTTSGGAISLLAPGGGITMASDIFGNPLTPPGIVTEFGGPISVFTDGSVDIGQARIFTLRGGDIIMWSSSGNIAAGNAARTVATAPPTRVVIDATSANVQTDLGGLATGGGIGVLASVAGVPPGDVDLIAPSGFVDAGDAGIRSTGNLTIASPVVLNANNIQVAGSSTGVPSAAPPAAPVVTAPPPPPPPANTPNPTAQEEERRREQAQDEPPSIIEVEILDAGE